MIAHNGKPVSIFVHSTVGDGLSINAISVNETKTENDWPLTPVNIRLDVSANCKNTMCTRDVRHNQFADYAIMIFVDCDVKYQYTNNGIVSQISILNRLNDFAHFGKDANLVNVHAL